jgi:uncharacterized protein
MSKDLSSKEQQIEKPQPNRFFKLFILVFGTIGLFFSGQIIGVYIVIGLFTIFGYDAAQIESMLVDNPPIQFLTILLIEIVTLGLLWWVHKVAKRPFISSIGLIKKPNFSSLGYAIVAYIIYFITLIITVALVSSLVPSIDIEQAQQIGFNGVEGYQLIFVFLTLVILPPIAEEIIFRGFLYQRLKSAVKIYPAAIITSIIFALAHTEFLGDNPLNWIAALDTFVLSFFLIWLLEKTKSLWASIFLHGIKNAIAFTVLFIL